MLKSPYRFAPFIIPPLLLTTFVLGKILSHTRYENLPANLCILSIVVMFFYFNQLEEVSENTQITPKVPVPPPD